MEYIDGKACNLVTIPESEKGFGSFQDTSVNAKIAGFGVMVPYKVLNIIQC